MPFQKGNKLGVGGPRPGSGRPSDWLKNKCREIVEKRKLIEFVSDVAEGKDISVMDGGMRVVGPAKVKERLDATEILVKHGFGESASAQIQVTFIQMLVGRFQAIVQRVIPISCPHCAKPLETRKSMVREMELLGTIDVEQVKQ